MNTIKHIYMNIFFKLTSIKVWRCNTLCKKLLKLYLSDNRRIVFWIAHYISPTYGDEKNSWEIWVKILYTFAHESIKYILEANSIRIEKRWFRGQRLWWWLRPKLIYKSQKKSYFLVTKLLTVKNYKLSCILRFSCSCKLKCAQISIIPEELRSRF